VNSLAQRLAAARLYLVCGAREDAFLDAALRGGVDLLQLRIKSGSDEELLAVGRRYARLCADRGVLFILNDRPDLVAPMGADGVHVGQDDMAVAAARELIGPERLLGLSTHTPEQVDAATGVDYIGVGPVHATPTKPGRPAVGLELIRYAAAQARVPFFAIGGIDPSNVEAVIDSGASQVAVVRALTESADPESTARELKATLLAPASIEREVHVGTT
jgi:thiamine-phosphate pyrophosphorylase